MYYAILFVLMAFAPLYFSSQTALAQTSPQQGQQTVPEPGRDPAMPNQPDDSYRQVPRDQASPGDPGVQGLQPGYGRESAPASRNRMGVWIWVVIALVALFAVLIPWTRRRRTVTSTDRRGGDPQV